MYPLFLALRYARSRAVTYLALLTVSLSVCSFVLIMAVLGGFRHKAEEIITKKASPLEVHCGSIYGVSDAADLAAAIEDIPGVKAASPFKEVLVLMRSRGFRARAGVRGVDLAKEVRFGAISEYLLANLPEMTPDSAAEGQAPRFEQHALRDLWQALWPWASKAVPPSTATPAKPAQVTSFKVPAELEIHATAKEDLEEGEEAPPPGEAGSLTEPGTLPIWESGPSGDGRPGASAGPRDPDSGVPLPPPPDPKSRKKKSPPKVEPIPRGAVIGAELARNLDLLLGDEIILSTLGENNEFRSRTFVVVGFYETKTQWLDEGISIDFRAAQDLAGMASATGVSVWLDDMRALPAMLPKVRAVVEDSSSYRPDITVRSWRDIQREQVDTLEMQDRVMMIILLVLLVLNGVFIMAILWVMVSDKTRDIGTVRALGAGRGGVVVTFVLQGMLIGVLGVLLGVAGGLALSENVNEVSDALDSGLKCIGIPPLFGSIAISLFGMNGLPVYYDPVHMVAVVLVTILISFLASLFPAWRAARLDPVEALRHD